MRATAQVDRLESEIITAISRGATTIPYVTSEIKRGERLLARSVLDQALDDGKILLTVDRRLRLPPE
jgi:hypothetical protein